MISPQHIIFSHVYDDKSSNHQNTLNIMTISFLRDSVDRKSGISHHILPIGHKRGIQMQKSGAPEAFYFYDFPYFSKSNSRNSSAILVPRLAHCVLIALCRCAGISIVSRFIGSRSSVVRSATHASASSPDVRVTLGLTPKETFLLIVQTPSVQPSRPRSRPLPPPLAQLHARPSPALPLLQTQRAE